MSCPIINKTNEEITNIVKHHGMLVDRALVQTQADLVRVMKEIHGELSAPKGEGARYTFMGIEIQRRVSDEPQKVFKRKRRNKAAIEHEFPNNIIYRDGGTKIHGVLEGLVSFYANKVGSLGQVKSTAQSGDFALSDLHFDRLNKTARDLVKQIKDLQATIDKSGSVEILTELRILDTVNDIGGTMDVVAVFSDMSVGIYDYKTINAPPWQLANRKGAEMMLIDDPITPAKEESYRLSVSQYRRIMVERYFAKSIRQSRIIPIHVKYKSKKEFKEHDSLLPQINVLQAGADVSKYLRQVPVAGEITQYPGIDRLLEKQSILLRQLQDKLQTQKMSREEQDRIKKRIKTLNTSIRETITSGDIRDITRGVTEVIDNFSRRSTESELKIDNTPNPLYLSNQELEDIVNELNVYRDLIENTASYFKELKTTRPELYTELKNRIGPLSVRVQDSYYFARSMREDRVLDEIPEEYKDELGNLLPTQELNFWERNFNLMSEIDHPIFKLAWKFVSESQYKMQRDLKNLDEDFAKVEVAFFEWAESQGLSRQKAYYKLINFERGKLHSRVSQELLNIKDKAYQDGDVETLKQIYQIRNADSLKKELQEAAGRAAEYYKNSYNNLKDLKDESGEIVKTAAQNTAEYNAAIKKWVKDHDVFKEDQAWLKDYNGHLLEFKPEILQKYKSSAYAEIERNKPVLDYYNTYTKYNDRFRELLGIKNYSELPSNFIPNIRREFIEHLTQTGTNIKTYTSEMVRALATRRDEDVYLADMDVNGDIKRNIPILFTNPLKNRNGEVDNNIKSYDLGKSLRLFGNMAFNYRYMNEIQPKINQLKDLLGNPTPDQGGIQVTNTLGNRVKGALKEFATKQGFDTDTYKLFEDMTDVYLYGIKFKEQSFIKGINTTQLLLKMKTYHAKRALSFAVIPAAGALTAGKIGIVIAGRKGVHFNTGDHLHSRRDRFTTPKKYKALGLFLNPYAESLVDRLSTQRSASFGSKQINDRMLFGLLRKADEFITDDITNSMKYNYGIDEGGNLVRMNKPGADLTGVKTIAELMTYDEKTGKVDIPGMSQEAFIALRMAIKSTVKGIIGSLSQEEVARYDYVLMMNLMMAFKSWMPGVVQERLGKLKYDNYSQAFSLGRARAISGEFLPTKSDFDSGIKMLSFISETAVPAIGRIILDLGTFGLAPTLGIKRVNLARARRRFTDWQLKDNKFRDATFEEYLEIKEAQIKAGLIEIRVLLAISSLILYLGGEGDDGEPRYASNQFTKKVYKVFKKAESELAFVWNPDEALGMIRNPVPLTSLLVAFKNTLENGLDETIDLLSGREDPYDKAYPGYHAAQWLFGGSQIMRLIDLKE